MMTLNHESSIQRERRREATQIAVLLERARGYLDSLDQLLDDIEAIREDGDDA